VAAVTALRYRCAACGNLTRFDVVTTSTMKAYHHYSVGGDLEIEDVEIISESVDSVSCRWCGHGRAVDVVDATVGELPDTPPGERAG
jgi:DNA-directed RNA polymerase subunit RPC12/RpoP